MSTLSQKIMNAVPGVRYAALINEDGASVNDGSLEAETLAARSIYFATMLAKPLSSAFGLGDLALATLDSDTNPLVIFRNKGKYLVVQAEDGASLDRIEVGIRKLFSQPQE